MLNDELVPSYYDTVCRPGPVHVNGVQGPAEMEGTPTMRVDVQKPIWQEVEVKVEGKMF